MYNNKAVIYRKKLRRPCFLLSSEFSEPDPNPDTEFQVNPDTFPDPDPDTFPDPDPDPGL